MTTTPSTEPLIRVRDLQKYFPLKRKFLSRERRYVQAVDGISFDVMRNQTVGLVGESGCGKTTAGRTLLRLLEPTGGEAIFRNRNIFELDRTELRSLRRHMQIIFQDPFSSLNPRMTIEAIIGDAVQVHGIAKGDEMRALVRSLLERVGLQPKYASRYPHEFSGGQRQRIGIARALALNPDFIVCDEAVSALDVSVQAQVLNLLEDLQAEFNLSFLFIAHDLSVVRHIADRVCVMYLGQIVEAADTDVLYHEPLHPYTQALLSAIPHANPKRTGHRIILEGDVPSPINPPSGCRFHTRCPVAFGACKKIVPRDLEIEPGHIVKCHLYDDDIKDIPRRSLERTRDIWRQLLKDTRPDDAVDLARESALFDRAGHTLDRFEDDEAPEAQPETARDEKFSFLPRAAQKQDWSCEGALPDDDGGRARLTLKPGLLLVERLGDDGAVAETLASVDLEAPCTVALVYSRESRSKLWLHVELRPEGAETPAVVLSARPDELGDVTKLPEYETSGVRLDTRDMRVVLSHLGAELSARDRSFE